MQQTVNLMQLLSGKSMCSRLTSYGATGEACPTLHAQLLALHLEAPGAAVALQVQALAAQGQVAACHVQAPNGSQLTVAALAVSIYTTYRKSPSYDTTAACY